MKVANATNLNRKSGGAKPRDLRCAIRVPAVTGPQPPPIITKSSWKPSVCHSGFPGVVRGTADPSASLLMTKRRVGVSSGNWFEGSQVSKARPGAPFDFTLDIAESTCFSESAARDDKERAAVHKERLLNRGILKSNLSTISPAAHSAVPAGLILQSVGSHTQVEALVSEVSSGLPVTTWGALSNPTSRREDNARRAPCPRILSR
jgi:hypothetical protein